jgi:hypothetical protein
MKANGTSFVHPQRRARIVSWSFSCLLLLSMACGAAKPVAKVEPPKPPSEPAAWIPDDPSVMGRVLLDPWRRTPLWQLWDKQAASGDASSWANFINVALIDEIAAGGRAQKDQPSSFVAAVRGRFGPDYLATRAKEKQLVAEPGSPLTFYIVGETRWAQVLPELLVMCSTDQMPWVRARATAGPAVKAYESPLYRSVGDRVQFAKADLAVLVDDSSGEARERLKQQASGVGFAHLADELVRAGLSVDLDTNVTMAAVAESADAPRAEALRKSVEETLAILSRNLIVGMLGLRPVVTALQPSVDGVHVAVRGTVPEQDMQALLAKAASLLEIAAQQQAGGMLIPAP